MNRRFPNFANGFAALALAAFLSGCATPGLMKQWEREEHRSVESENFVVYLDDNIPRTVGREVLDSLEFARERVGMAIGFYSDEKIVCNLYQNEKSLRTVTVGMPLGLVVPRRAPLAYVLGGEVHGRLYCTPSGNVSRLWVSTFPHEYCHIMFKEVTGRHYFQYSWLQEGLGEYFRRLYLQERVTVDEFAPKEPQVHAAVHDHPHAESILLTDSKNGVWSFTDWEVRDALRRENLVPLKKLAPMTFFGYWQKFNTPEANQIYAISSSAVEFLIDRYGWDKMKLTLEKLKDTRSLDRVLEEVYGFDQDGLFRRWKDSLDERWPEPWEPEIEMLYLVRGNWEIDGHEAGIRTALAQRDADAVQRHQRYLLTRSASGMDPAYVLPVTHSGRTLGGIPGLKGGTAFRDDSLAEPVFLHNPNGGEEPPPALEHFDTAMAEFSVGNFEVGVRHLLTVVEEEPEQAGYVRTHLARGLWILGQRKKALELFEEDLRLKDDPPFVNEVAWCYEKMGDWDRAIELYEDVENRSKFASLRQHAINRIDRMRHLQNRQADTGRASLSYAY